MELGVPVEGLEVRFKDGKATVEGKAESQAHRETVIIAIGNTQGVSSSDPDKIYPGQVLRIPEEGAK